MSASRVPGNYSPMPGGPPGGNASSVGSPGNYVPPPGQGGGPPSSYVPPPKAGGFSNGASIPGMSGPGNFQPGGPPSLTQSIPDPGAIARQKDVYLKMLDDQLKQGINVLDQQVKYQRDYLNVQCEQQKKQFLLQLDQQMKAQEMVLTQQYNEQLMVLQTQAGTQKAALEQQAMQLSMEYEQRKAEEHMYRQQYEIQQQQTEMAVKMARDYQRLIPGSSPPGVETRGTLGPGLGSPPMMQPPPDLVVRDIPGGRIPSYTPPALPNFSGGPGFQMPTIGPPGSYSPMNAGGPPPFLQYGGPVQNQYSPSPYPPPLLVQ